MLILFVRVCILSFILILQMGINTQQQKRIPLPKYQSILISSAGVFQSNSAALCNFLPSSIIFYTESCRGEGQCQGNSHST